MEFINCLIFLCLFFEILVQMGVFLVCIDLLMDKIKVFNMKWNEIGEFVIIEVLLWISDGV